MSVEHESASFNQENLLGVDLCGHTARKSL